MRAEYCGDSKEPRESCPEAPSSSLGVGRRVPWAFPLHPLTPLTAKAKSQAWPPPTANAPGRPLLQGACTVTALLHPYLGPSQPTGGSQGRWGGLRGNKLPVSSSSPPHPHPWPPWLLEAHRPLLAFQPLLELLVCLGSPPLPPVVPSAPISRLSSDAFLPWPLHCLL